MQIFFMIESLQLDATGQWKCIAHNCIAHRLSSIYSQAKQSAIYELHIFHVDNCSVYSEWLTLADIITAADDIATITIYTIYTNTKYHKISIIREKRVATSSFSVFHSSELQY